MREDIHRLFSEQMERSERFQKAFASLHNGQTRKIEFDGFSYTLQLNPARIKSSTANINKPLDEENCFLCKKNMPTDQMKRDYDGEFFLSVNPFPILNTHLTIISHDHRPQSIKGNTMRMLGLADYMEEGFTVFYNSPKSGASAPFHCHFQAGVTSCLPAFMEIESIRDKYTVKEYHGDTFLIKEPTRGIVLIETKDINKAGQRFTEVLDQLSRIYNTDEPEANIGVTKANGSYRIILFPRDKHRPEEYYREGDSKILVSPGFADMAGMIPCSLVNNYNNIAKEDIISIMNQVSIPIEKLMKIEIK